MVASEMLRKARRGEPTRSSSFPDIPATAASSGPVPPGILVDPKMTADPKDTRTSRLHIPSSSTRIVAAVSSTPVSSQAPLSLASTSMSTPVAVSTGPPAAKISTTAAPVLGMAKLTMIIVVPVVVLVILTPILLIWLVMRRRKNRSNLTYASSNEKNLLSSRDQSPKRPPKRGDLFRKPWERPIGSRRQRMTFSGFDFDFPAPRSARSSISTRSPRCVTRNEKSRLDYNDTVRGIPPPPYPAALKSKIRFGLPANFNRHPLPDLPREAGPEVHNDPVKESRTRQNSSAPSVRSIFSLDRHPRGRTRSSSLIPPYQITRSASQTNQQGTNAWLNSYPYPLSRSLTVRSLSLEDIQSAVEDKDPSRRQHPSVSSPVLTDISGMSFDPSMWVGLYDRTAPASPAEARMAINPRQML